jgi:hypothetical protein
MPQNAGAFVRAAPTWYCYLLIGSFVYFLNIQGNILPFLKSELDLSYRAVSLHATALAICFVSAGAFAALADIHGPRRQAAINEAAISGYVFGAAAPLIVSAAVALGFDWRVGIAVGVISAIFVLVFFRAAPLPDAAAVHQNGAALPAAYWAYWLALGTGVSLEFSALLWAPEYLEKIVGLTRAAAAAAVVAFMIR